MAPNSGPKPALEAQRASNLFTPIVEKWKNAIISKHASLKIDHFLTKVALRRADDQGKRLSLGRTWLVLKYNPV